MHACAVRRIRRRRAGHYRVCTKDPAPRELAGHGDLPELPRKRHAGCAKNLASGTSELSGVSQAVVVVRKETLMQTLIIYDSRFGNTEKVAQAIARGITSGSEVRL